MKLNFLKTQKMTKNDYQKRFLDMFHAVTIGEPTMDFATVNRVAMPLGFIVKAEACTRTVYSWLNEQNIDRNSTFYRNWDDVTSKTRFELFIDQVMHYMTTYGTGFAMGNGYVPRELDGGDEPYFEYEKYTVIEAITPKDMYTRVMDMLKSGIAINSQNLEALCTYVFDYVVENQVDVEIDDIVNREARIMLYDMLGLSPKDKFELVRYMVYKATGTPMVICSKLVLQTIRANANNFDFATLTEKQCEDLSSIFYRFKDIILQFKPGKHNAPVINHIRRLAVKNHKPMKPGFWENLINLEIVNNDTYQDLYVKTEELTNYKLVTLMNMLHERIIGQAKNMYVIRNKRIFVKDNTNTLDQKRTNELRTMYNVLYTRLINNMQKKALTPVISEDPMEENTVRKTRVYIPANVHFAAPTSEKNFIGNLPFGTYVDMTGNSIIGIYWRNEWGTRDFDLSMNNIQGQRIGWNSSYYDRGRGADNQVIYSGDMTNADPQATELLYMKKDAVPGIIYCNRFSGTQGSQFKVFFAKECLDNKNMHGYMVDPNNIIAETMCISDMTQKMVGMVLDQKFVFADFGCGNSIVANSRNGFTAEDMYKLSKVKCEAMVFVNDILKDAGFEFVNKPEDADINLGDLAKDTFISLFDNKK